MSGGWIDRHGNVWTEGDDGLMHTPETAPFSREHVERKWGPLTPEPSEVAETTAGERECLAGPACPRVQHADACRPVCGFARCAEPDAGEVEALAKVINPSAFTADFRSSQDGARSMARAVLASPWLAAHVSAAETKARGDERERIAKAIESIPTYIATPAHGGYSREGVSPESVRRRAASIARGDAR